MKTQFLTTIFFLAFIFNGIGQDVWKKYNTTNTGDNGLVGGFITCFHNDDKNVLWIGTPFGISQFDGANWHTLTKLDGLITDAVGDIVQDKNNNYWFSYGSYIVGVSRFDGSSFTHFDEDDGLISNKVNDIMVDSDGNIWFATVSGISMYNGSSWKSYTTENGLPDEWITCLAEDKEGNIWIGTSGAGTYLLQNDAIIPFSWESEYYNYVHDIYIDVTGNVWVSTNEVHKYNNNWELIDPIPPGESGWVNDFEGDETGRIFFSTSVGFTIMDGNTFSYYNADDNIPNNRVNLSYYKNDSIWVGTKDGIAVFANQEWTAFTPDDNGLINNDVNSAFEDDNNNMWFCTNWGISQYDGSTWKNYKYTENGTEIQWVSKGIQDRNGVYWFCTTNGIFIFNNSSWEILNYEDGEIFSGWVWDIIEDKEGNIWISSSNYLLKYDGSNWTHYNQIDGFQSKYLEALFQDSKGRIWIGSRAGISVYENQSFKHYISGEDFIDIIEVLAFMEEPDGKMYAVTYDYILTFENDEWIVADITDYWFSHGMSDLSDQIWISTYWDGLIKYNETEWTSLTTEDGLSANLVFSSYRTKDGNFYICTNFGITEIKPEITIGTPVITKEEGLETYTLKLESSGITTPYWFSKDNIGYEQNDGIFHGLQKGTSTFYITNAYDTLQLDILIDVNAIDNLSEEDIARLFPNPFSNRINLDIEITENYNLDIYSLSGRKVRSFTNLSANGFIDVSDLKKGVYLFKLFNEKGEQSKLMQKL